MKKAIVLLAFLILLPSALSVPYLKCEKKGARWECVYEGSKCEVTQSEIKCEILETPFGSERKKISVFGTEYEPNDYGRIFLQLTDKQQPVNNATCLIDIYKPDLSPWFKEAYMVYLPESDGLYYFDVIIPEETGVYMLTVECFYIVDWTEDYADSFTLEIGSAVSGDYSDTWVFDGTCHAIKEKISGGGNRISFYYDFYNVSVPSNYTGMGITWRGKWDSGEEFVHMKIWDWCASSWIYLPNKITTNTPMVTQYLPKEDYNVSCLLSNGIARIGFEDSQVDKVIAGALSTDLIRVEMNYLTWGAIEIIRGGGEIHVTNHTKYAVVEGAEKTWETFFVRGTPIEKIPVEISNPDLMFLIIIAILLLAAGLAAKLGG